MDGQTSSIGSSIVRFLGLFRRSWAYFAAGGGGGRFFRFVAALLANERRDARVGVEFDALAMEKRPASRAGQVRIFPFSFVLGTLVVANGKVDKVFDGFGICGVVVAGRDAALLRFRRGRRRRRMIVISFRIAAFLLLFLGRRRRRRVMMVGGGGVGAFVVRGGAFVRAFVFRGAFVM